MHIKLELIKEYLIEKIVGRLLDFEMDATEVADTVAICMLSEIQKIIQNEAYSDFDVGEEIVRVFEEHGIDFGVRHDF